MDKITINNKKESINIIIDNIKYVTGNDYEIRDKIKKVLINKFNKIGQSDYAEDNYVSEILINDEPIVLGDYLFYYVDANFDLVQDTKLGTKSLSLEYVNSLLDNIEYSDEYQTINNLLNNMFEDVLENVDDLIRPSIECILSKKILIKLMEISFLNEDSIINNYDLSLEERIVIQLKMIKQIAKTSHKKLIVLIDSPIITKPIKDEIVKIKGKVIVLFNKILRDEYYDVLILDKIRVDIADEEALFDLCNNDKNAFFTIDQMKNKVLNEYLYDKFL